MIECSCDCSYGDGEHCEVYSETFPVARKIYRCCECGQDISLHQKYHKYKGCWSGKWDTYKTCITCYKIRQEYCFHGYQFGGLRDALVNCFDIDYLEVPED